MDKVKRFREIVTDMADLYAAKNENYGDSFGKLYEDLGPVAGLVPLHNKLDRATNLVKGGENKFESLEDTFKDLACYAIMNLIAMEEAKMKETENVKVSKTEEDKNSEIIDTLYTGEEDNYTFPTTISSPCLNCRRRFLIGACDGCAHNTNIMYCNNKISTTCCFEDYQLKGATEQDCSEIADLINDAEE